MSTADRLAEAIDRHDWETAVCIQEFRGDDDATVYELMSCPATSRVALLRLSSHVDLWTDDRVVDRVVLDESEGARAKVVVRSEWRTPLERRERLARQ